MKNIILSFILVFSMITTPMFAAGQKTRAGHGYRKCCASSSKMTNCCALAAIAIIGIIILSETSRGGNSTGTTGLE